MSSFFGMARQDGKPVGERLLQRMADEFTFRGPDGTSLWRGANVSACFPRMCTSPAPQAAQQPVTLGTNFSSGGISAVHFAFSETTDRISHQKM
jgi:asparagine synthetase B (glutamine-hydrolysing)